MRTPWMRLAWPAATSSITSGWKPAQPPSSPSIAMAGTRGMRLAAHAREQDRQRARQVEQARHASVHRQARVAARLAPRRCRLAAVLELDVLGARIGEADAPRVLLDEATRAVAVEEFRLRALPAPPAVV